MSGPVFSEHAIGDGCDMAEGIGLIDEVALVLDDHECCRGRGWLLVEGVDLRCALGRRCQLSEGAAMLPT